MLSRILHCWNNKIKNIFHSNQRHIVYVSDGSRWSFYWDAYYITKGLKERHNVPTKIVREPWHLRNQIIQFGDRYAYFFGPREKLHPSNVVLLTWFHGEPDDPNVGMRKLFSMLPEALSNVDKVVVSCSRSKEVLVEYGVPSDKIILIPLGVDTNVFRPAIEPEKIRIRRDIGLSENAFVIGSFQKDGCGWGDGEEPKPVKGPDIFLEAIARLKKRHANIEVLLTGPARGYVRKGLEQMRIPYVHQFLDNYQEIVSRYQALDAYIIASRAEGGPKALLECWATGVPVVSTRMGMPADLIVNRRNGILVSIDDAAGLADGINLLVNNLELQGTMRKQALEDVRKYDWCLVADQYYEKLYSNYLKR